MLGVTPLSLTLHAQRPLTEGRIAREEKLAELRQSLERVAGRTESAAAVAPLVVARQVDESMVRQIEPLASLQEDFAFTSSQIKISLAP